MVDDKQIARMVGGLRKPQYEGVEDQGYGERAFRVYGKKMDLIVWDEGNSNYSIVRQIEHKTRKSNWVKHPRPGSNLWENKKYHTQINLVTDSSKRWFVTVWRTNRLHNAVAIIKSWSFIQTKKEALKIAKDYMKKHPRG